MICPIIFGTTVKSRHAPSTASSSGTSISVASSRARSTRNWGRAREGSREGENAVSLPFPFRPSLARPPLSQRERDVCGRGSTYYLKEAEMKIALFAHFKEYQRNHKNFKSLYDFGGAVSKLEAFVWILNHISRSISYHPNSVILGQMTNLNTIFHVVVSVYRFVKI